MTITMLITGIIARNQLLGSHPSATVVDDIEEESADYAGDQLRPYPGTPDHYVILALCAGDHHCSDKEE